MKSKKTFLVAGGDSRQIYLAKKLSDMYNILMTGFDNCEYDLKNMDISEISDNEFDGIILPIPASADGITVNTPFSEKKIRLDSLIQKLKTDGIIFGGKINDKVSELFKKNNIDFEDYSKREEFSVLNAVATAEGALQIAIENSSETIFSQKILITGFGRIAKALVKILKGLGADVTVSARKKSDLAWAEFYGCKTINIKNPAQFIDSFNIVFNTVPCMIFDENILMNMNNKVLLIDLASKPGGAVFD